MLRRHFLMTTEEPDLYPYINNRNRDWDEPDYIIQYTADAPVRFMGGIADNRVTYTWGTVSDLQYSSTTPFVLVQDIYNPETKSGHWGFKGQIPKTIGDCAGKPSDNFLQFGSLDASVIYNLDNGELSLAGVLNSSIISLILPEGVECIYSTAMNLGLGPNPILYAVDELQNITFPSTMKHLPLRSLPDKACKFYNQTLHISNQMVIHELGDVPGGDWPYPAQYFNTFDNIEIAEDNPYYKYDEENGVVISKTTFTYIWRFGISQPRRTVQPNVLLMTTKKTKAIPNTVTELHDGCFMNSQIESIEIPDSVKTIGKGVFHGCTNLKSVVIGTGVTKISSFIFAACTSPIEIRYKGTKEQWNAISKPIWDLGEWNTQAPQLTIICSDGVI